MEERTEDGREGDGRGRKSNCSGRDSLKDTELEGNRGENDQPHDSLIGEVLDENGSYESTSGKSTLKVRLGSFLFRLTSE